MNPDSIDEENTFCLTRFTIFLYILILNPLRGKKPEVTIEKFSILTPGRYWDGLPKIEITNQLKLDKTNQIRGINNFGINNLAVKIPDNSGWWIISNFLFYHGSGN
jgi:hypothetical protein